MPTLLRALMGLVATLVMAGGPVLLVLAGPRSDAAGMIAVFAFLLVSFPPFFAGLFASYWSFSGGDAARRARRTTAVLIAVQVLGSVALVGVLAASGPGSVVAAAGVVLLSVVLFPGFVALGRLARRLEEAQQGPTSDVWIDTTQDEIHRGWRNIAIGFGVGLLLLAGLAALAVALPPRHRHDLALGFDGLSLAVILGALGSYVTTFRISRRLRNVIGSDYDAARRIRRAIWGKLESLDADEQRRATRYARVLGRWMPFQVFSSVLLLVGIALQQVGRLVSGEADGVAVVTLAGYAVLVAVLVPFTVVRTRRIRAYADAHTLVA